MIVLFWGFHAIGMILLSVCLSVSVSVTLCIVAK